MNIQLETVLRILGIVLIYHSGKVAGLAEGFVIESLLLAIAGGVLLGVSERFERKRGN